MIEFEDVTKRYPDGTVAVDNLSLRIPSHQITVFVGPSGCGKTTSLRMINRTIERTSGTISIDGEDINSKDAVTLRRGIGYVIQNAGLFPHKTVVENVATVPKLLGWDKRKAHSTAMELLERVGLDLRMAERYPAQLSGGQQQRVGVARALAADPLIMLMDEPFSAVDPIVRDQLQEELLRLQRDIGKTIVFVTHDIDEAIKLGDNIAVLRVGGKLAQFAPPSELLANPVDDFVESFIGKDRGYRALTFVTADELRLSDVPAELKVAADGSPVGWVNGAAGLEPVGATFQRGDSLRAALDAVLTSPVGKGVCVDETGKAVGVIEYATLTEALTS
ncbi:ABC transporter ATP-binding protein [Kribbella sp. NBC_01505]|uniref:ABC transporter ATP-binding protein n=1 Tax=Kribbella sp. NBC_01505 TaxID=2903580 RepID=UPI0038679F61